jgi:ribosome-associated heat shock protein Hsp15
MALACPRDAHARGRGGAGKFRLRPGRIRGPGCLVRIGDVITVALDRAVRVLKVTDFTDRRGPAEMGRSLYEELLT